MTGTSFMTSKTFDEMLLENEELQDCASVFGGYEDFGFESDVEVVFRAMVTEDAFGTMVLSWECSTDGVINGANFVIAVQTVTGDSWGWLGVYRELKHLTDNREATGVEGYRAIWDALTCYILDAEALVDASLLTVRK